MCSNRYIDVRIMIIEEQMRLFCMIASGLVKYFYICPYIWGAFILRCT